MNPKASQANSTLSTDQARFRASGIMLIQLIQAAGHTLALTQNESLPYFCALSADGRKSALQRLETMIEVCRSTMDAGHDLNDARAMLTAYFKLSGTRSTTDIFDRIHEDDNIEIYCSSQQFVFANLRLFTLTSFTIEDLYCRPWTDLLSRDIHGLHEKLYATVADILSERTRKLLPTTFLPDHVCREEGSPQLRSFILFPNFFAPLMSGERTIGVICSNKIFPHREVRPRLNDEP